MKKDEAYWEQVRAVADEIESDGCSKVPDFYGIACAEHDIHYRLHHRLDGSPITKAEADWEFRQAIQSHSKLGRFSPMSWWRWLGVKWFGQKAWED